MRLSLWLRDINPIFEGVCDSYWTVYWTSMGSTIRILCQVLQSLAAPGWSALIWTDKDPGKA